jgi:uncharacterized protein
VNIGSMFRNGWDNNIKSADVIPVLEGGSKTRTAEAEPPLERCRWLRSARKMPRTRSWKKPGNITTRHAANTQPFLALRRPEASNQIITYDAYNMAEVFLTQPLQIVAGSVAGGI